MGRVERQNRLHASTAAFQLQVYDLAMKGETFGSINRLLKKKPSTVKSGYLAAIAKIYGQSKSDRPVRTLALKSFDPTQHLKNCKTCQSANSIETMCTICQVFTKQDHCGLRELLSDGSAELF
ncbi:MAG: hypothetical protein E6R14_03590 [Thermomicrobiales bacterium]|nr:MAG: hypothetical protein E6R14_03590 [Thermomicrobiales bacterium]